MSFKEQLDVAFAAEPIIAWRAWNLAIARGSPRLLPVGDQRRPWPTRRAARAGCIRHRSHRAPRLDCTCGLHGSKDVSLLQRTRGPTVIGTTALWGRVVEHQLGYRAESAYPQRLRLLCPVCFWQRGLEGSPPGIAAVSRGGLVVPLCDEHVRTSEACGFRVLRRRSARDLEGELLAAYAVDLFVA